MITIWTLAAHHENLAVTISVLAFLVSGFSLGWNIFRDVILKARVRVSFDLGQFRYTSGHDKRRLWLSAVNLGPGEVTLEMPIVRTQPALLAWLKKEESLALVIHEYAVTSNSPLPAKLAVTEKMRISFPIEENCILDRNPLRIGIRDTFGRNHWASVKNLKKALRDYSRLRSQDCKHED